MSASVRRLALPFLVLLGLASIAAGALHAVACREYGRELARARQELSRGFPHVAYHRLKRLQARWPRDGAVGLELGQCALARGRRDEAIDVWARVPPGAPEYPRAAGLRATHLINMGRYAAAERVLDAVLATPGSEAFELSRIQSRLYRFEGRAGDVRRVLQRSWPQAPDRAAVLRELWLLDKSPWPVEAWARALEKADPNDDRVWLGRANLAIGTGRFDEAARWLDECLHRGRADEPVRRAQLDLGWAADDPATAWAAAEKLPADALEVPEQLSLQAWFANRLADTAAERRALERLLECDPGNALACDRLAVLAHEAGRPDEAARYRERKAAIDDTQDRCRKLLLSETNLVAGAGALARLTGRLGRSFEARGWALLAGQPAPVETAERRGTLPVAAGTLAEALHDVRSPAGGWAGARGGRSSPARPAFHDAATAAGLGAFVFDNGQTPLRQLPETMSGGIALLDYDGDGWLDVYAVQGGAAEGRDTDHLWRNNGDGTFSDRTGPAGIASFAHEYSLGVAVGDYDNDGDPDLFITRVRSYALYRNRGDGTFADVTNAAGLAGVRDNPSSAAFADLDNDGDLDLYVCHYMLYDPANPRLCKNDHGAYFYCDPSKVDPAPDHVFRNDQGRFVDVTEEAGFVDRDGRGLGVVAADLDGDHRIDLFVANDGTANYLYRNLGGFRFEEIAHAAGVAGNAQGGYQAGMGVACGDLDGDGNSDLFVTNFYGEGTTFYQNLGHGLFTDRSAAVGLVAATRYLLGFGIALLDFDNDGRLDLVQANGHVNDNRPYYPYAMPTKLFAGTGAGRLTDVSTTAGSAWGIAHVGRGLAAGDLDNDGKVDAVLLAQNEPLAYFHNDTSGTGNFLTLRLEGKASNRDGVGARVTVTAGRRAQCAQRVGGGSYQSGADPRLHFGLRTESQAESVKVEWPSGRTDCYTALKANRSYVLREGEPSPRPLPGYHP